MLYMYTRGKKNIKYSIEEKYVYTKIYENILLYLYAIKFKTFKNDL